NAVPRCCVESLVNDGYRCVVCAVNEAGYDAGLLGKVIDRDFLENLPDGIDAAGENGEYHTFVVDGPLFQVPVACSLGRITSKEFALSSNQSDEAPGQNPTFYFQ